MKQYIIITLLGLFTFSTPVQSQDTPNGFGFAINSSLNGELDPIRIVPSIIYFNGKSQFELGMGFNPFGRQIDKLLSGEINYKYFPNGRDEKFNMFFISRITYVNNVKKTYYPTAYNYLFVHGGYGFEIIPFKNASIGTNVSLGAFTFDKKSEVPYDAFKSQIFFDEIGGSLAFQVSIGYRFCENR
ncbi:hypothetical protein [Brumimicrobium mesophilum]|uniref:hypothetical protein n=1 Tax=Brumimicrobium mesophilum TaxID=392717 RepID=UPI00131DCB19|nr:hypothetical protein [Brumimicrobium mesophilum]